MTIWSSISTYTIAWIARSAYRLTWSAMLTRHCCTSCVNYVKCHNDDLAFSIYYVYNIVTNTIVIRILLKCSSCIYDDVVSTAPSIAWIRAYLRRIQSIGGPVVVSIKLGVIYFNISCTKYSRFCQLSFLLQKYLCTESYSIIDQVVWIYIEMLLKLLSDLKISMWL